MGTHAKNGMKKQGINDFRRTDYGRPCPPGKVAGISSGDMPWIPR